MTDIFFSLARKIALEEELLKLQSIERTSVAEGIENAKSHGDLSENAEYHAARERQAKLEDRIQEIEYMLKNGKLIDSSDTSVVKVGHQVVVKNLTKDSEATYTIVGQEEQDIMKGLISNASPIAQALLGAKVGDEVSYNTPQGTCTLRIMLISTT